MSAKTLGIAGGLVIGAALITAWMLPSCNRNAKPTPTPVPTSVEVAGAGVVEGTIRFEGTPPKMRRIATPADPACPEVTKESVLVGENGGLANVVVRVLDPPGAWPVPATPVKVDQTGCRYDPHVVAIRSGQKVEIHTSDPTTHNVHAWAGRRSLFNESMTPGAGPRIRELGAVPFEQKLVCDMHPWMRAYVLVVDHPLFAVTDPDGAFRIEGVPPGEHTLEIWHEEYGTQRVPVTVTDGETVTADASVSAGT